MSALEIVLVSVLGCIAIVSILGVLVMHALQENKAQNLDILNETSEKDKIVFFGDSLTDFYPVQEFFPQHHIYNRGIANDTTTDLLNRIENVTDIHPKKLFLLIGTNDLGKHVPQKKILQNIDRIIELVKQSSPDVKIYVLSQYPVHRGYKFFSFVSCGFRNNKNLFQLSEAERAYCAEKGYTFINIWTKLIDEKGNLRKEYTIEGLHLTTRGYQVVSNCLKPYIYD